MRTVRVGGSCGKAIVRRVGIDQHTTGAVVLGEVDLDATEVSAITDQDDPALKRDAGSDEALEVGETAVVRVDNLAGDIAGRRGAVEAGQDTGVVLRVAGGAAGYGVNVLGARARQERRSLGVNGVDGDGCRAVQQDRIGHDLGLQPGCAKTLRDVFRGSIVFR